MLPIRAVYEVCSTRIRILITQLVSVKEKYNQNLKVTSCCLPLSMVNTERWSSSQLMYVCVDSKITVNQINLWAPNISTISVQVYDPNNPK